MPNNDIYLYALIFGAAVLLYYFVVQWAYEIKKRNRYLQAIIKLLSAMAKKDGVPDNEIRKILNEAGRTEETV